MAKNPLLRDAAPAPAPTPAPGGEPKGPQAPKSPPRVHTPVHDGVIFQGVGDLRIAETLPPEVPEAVEYISADGEYKRLKDSILAGLNVCLVGPPGSGKTTMLRAVCSELGIPMVPFQCGRGVTLDHILGFRDLTQENGAPVTNVVPGPLMRSMVHGAIFYPDEIDTLDDGVSQHLGCAMDDRKELAPPEWRGIVIKGKPGFLVVSSTNADFIRDGRAISEHIRDRFVYIRVNYLPAARESALVQTRTGIAPAIADKMVEVANRLRKARVTPTPAGVTFKSHVSTRTLLDWAKLVKQGESPREAGLSALVEKIPLNQPKDESLARDTLDAVFPPDSPDLKGAQKPEDLPAEGTILTPIQMRASNIKKFGVPEPDNDAICKECGLRNGGHNARTNECPGKS